MIKKGKGSNRETCKKYRLLDSTDCQLPLRMSAYFEFLSLVGLLKLEPKDVFSKNETLKKKATYLKRVDTECFTGTY